MGTPGINFAEAWPLFLAVGLGVLAWRIYKWDKRRKIVNNIMKDMEGRQHDNKHR